MIKPKMDAKLKFILIPFGILLAISLLLSSFNLYSSIMVTIEKTPPHSLYNIYNRLYNLLYYVRVPFNPPAWEQKKYIEEVTPDENLKTTKLPVFDLYIGDDDLHQLDQNIPKDPAFQRNNPQYYSEETVNGVFKCEGKTYDVKVRYRGLGWWHWRTPKKSMRIKFPKQDLFFGSKQINLVNPKEVVPFTQVVEYSMARYLGLLAPDTYMAHVRLNDKYYGIMFVFNQPDKFFLEENNRPEGDIYGEKESWKPLFTDARYWEKYSVYDKNNPDDFRNLERFLKILTLEDRDEFKAGIAEMLDMDKFYRWYIHSIILTSAHQELHNIRLYYDPVKRKFEFIPWDVLTRFEEGRSIDYAYNAVNRKILSYPEFGEEKNRVLWRLVKDDSLLNKILALIDELDDATREDIFCDRHRGGSIFKTGERYDYQYRYPASLYEKTLGQLKEFYIKRFESIRRQLTDCRVRAYIKREGDDYYLHVILHGKVGYKLHAIRVGLTGDRAVDLPQDVTILPERYANPATDTQEVVFLPNEVSIRIELEKCGEGVSFGDVEKITLTGENGVTGVPVIPEISAKDSVYDFDIENIYPSSMVRRPVSEASVIAEEKSAEAQTKIIRVEKGVRELNENLIVKKDELLVIEPGALIYLHPNASILVYGGVKAIGTREEPITITGKDKMVWGSFVLDGSPYKDNAFDFCNISLGSKADVDGAVYTGMLSVYNSDVIITNSTIEQAKDDDAVSAKYSNAVIKDCVFIDNTSDAIDYDFCGGIIEGNAFTASGGDAIDLSFSTAKILSNRISGCVDKGVSVGEKSNVVLDGLVISDCGIGIAVKDLSSAMISNCKITNNKKGIALYRKKAEFGGGKADIEDTLVKGNDEDITADTFSEFTMKNSEAEKVRKGVDNASLVSELYPKGK